MTFVPLGLTERQHPARAPWLVGREDSHVDLDLGAPERIGDHVGRDLTRFTRPFCPTPSASAHPSMGRWHIGPVRAGPTAHRPSPVPPTTGYDDAT